MKACIATNGCSHVHVGGDDNNDDNDDNDLTNDDNNHTNDLMVNRTLSQYHRPSSSLCCQVHASSYKFMQILCKFYANFTQIHPNFARILIIKHLQYNAQEMQTYRRLPHISQLGSAFVFLKVQNLQVHSFAATKSIRLTSFC